VRLTLADDVVPIPADQVDFLIATAARAPSVHNTQPWRFGVGTHVIELLADPSRKLRTDPLGREMLLSCGAALFGLRLAIRSLGYRPVVTLFPERSKLRLLARVVMVAGTPMTAVERQMLDAVPHRHTHRGAFSSGPLPPGLLAAMQHDALTESAALSLVQRSSDYAKLADLLAATAPRQDLDPIAQAEVLRWSRPAAGDARDGIPASAFPAQPSHEAGRLRQRDFDLGRGIGFDEGTRGGGPPATTAVLLTLRDRRSDWLKAGQALQRVLLHAASRWVYASLYTQPLESAEIRALLRDRLALPGYPQVVMQLGLVGSTEPTSRRPPADVIEP
jgi:nitroreductase